MGNNCAYFPNCGNYRSKTFALGIIRTIYIRIMLVREFYCDTFGGVDLVRWRWVLFDFFWSDLDASYGCNL